MDPSDRRAQSGPLGVEVAKRLAVGLGVIALTAGAFAFVGARDLGTPVPSAAQSPAAGEDETPRPSADPGPDDSSGTAEETVDPEPTEVEVDASDEPEEPEPDAVSEPEPHPEPEAEPEPEPAPEPEPEPEVAVQRAFAPGDITIQVLDGYKADGGAAARRVAEALRAEGYRVVAENKAVDYTVTTVLWTAGHEAQARQVAGELAAGDVRPQPGNLSESVTVHVVVGADRG